MKSVGFPGLRCFRIRVFWCLALRASNCVFVEGSGFPFGCERGMLMGSGVQGLG